MNDKPSSVGGPGDPKAPDGPMWGPGSHQGSAPDQAAGSDPVGGAPWTPPTSSTPPPSEPMWGPQAEPQPGPPPPPQPGPMWGTGGTPPAAKATGMSGCVKVVIVLLVLLIVAVIVLVVAAGTFVNSVVPGGIGAIGNGSGDDNCPFLSDSEARTLLGGTADGFELSGLYEASIGLIIDKRVLPTAEDCWITEADRAYIARIARSEGPDAAGVFARELQNAQPVSQDQGNGVTVTDAGYFGGDIQGLGDQAFCTGYSLTGMAGVLVRQGDRLLYVSLGPPDETKVPDLESTAAGVITAPTICATAQEVARQLLR